MVKGEQLARPARPKPHEAARHRLADDEVALDVERHPVRLERRAARHLHAGACAPAPARVAGNVTEIQTAFDGVPDRSFGELVAGADAAQLGCGIDQRGKRSGVIGSHADLLSVGCEVKAGHAKSRGRRPEGRRPDRFDCLEPAWTSGGVEVPVQTRLRAICAERAERFTTPAQRFVRCCVHRDVRVGDNRRQNCHVVQLEAVT